MAAMNPKRSAWKVTSHSGLAPAQSHQIRIIGGLLKRTRIAVLDMPGLRPTPDRVRETLFNWLGQDLTGWVCTDAFAGTGALGLEAASRGAASVTSVESDARVCKHLKQTVQALGLDGFRVVHGDGVTFMATQDAARQDIVFLDPPFDQDLFESAMREARRLVRPGGWVYLESPSQWADAKLADLGFELYRHLKAGRVHAHLLRPIAAGGLSSATGELDNMRSPMAR